MNMLGALSDRAMTKADRTREQIVAAGARELARCGYAGASLRRIARDAGLGSGSLYFHFETKADLADAVLDEAVSATMEAIDRAVEALGPDAGAAQRLVAAVAAHVEALHASPDHGAAVLRLIDAPPAEREHLSTRHERRYWRTWRQLLHEAASADALGPGDVDLDALTTLVIAAMNGARGSRRRRATAIETLLALLLRS